MITWSKFKLSVTDDDCRVSPLVPVSKPDGIIRWAVDFRSLNERTKMLHTSLPRMSGSMSTESFLIKNPAKDSQCIHKKIWLEVLSEAS